MMLINSNNVQDDDRFIERLHSIQLKRLTIIQSKGSDDFFLFINYEVWNDIWNHMKWFVININLIIIQRCIIYLPTYGDVAMQITHHYINMYGCLGKHSFNKINAFLQSWFMGSL